ncbi:MAG: hypothetical protein AAFP69_18555, partial [Planctomycetota bacterium]
MPSERMMAGFPNPQRQQGMRRSPRLRFGLGYVPMPGQFVVLALAIVACLLIMAGAENVVAQQASNPAPIDVSAPGDLPADREVYLNGDVLYRWTENLGRRGARDYYLFSGDARLLRGGDRASGQWLLAVVEREIQDTPNNQPGQPFGGRIRRMLRAALLGGIRVNGNSIANTYTVHFDLPDEPHVGAQQVRARPALDSPTMRRLLAALPNSSLNLRAAAPSTGGDVQRVQFQSDPNVNDRLLPPPRAPGSSAPRLLPPGNALSDSLPNTSSNSFGTDPVLGPPTTFPPMVLDDVARPTMPAEESVPAEDSVPLEWLPPPAATLRPQIDGDGTVVDSNTGGIPFDLPPGAITRELAGRTFVLPGLGSVNFQSRNDAIPTRIETQNRLNETLVIARAGVRVVVRGAQIIDRSGAGDLGTIQFDADRVVAWLPPAQQLFSGDSRQALQNADGELYLEGNIVLRQGQRIVYADRMYYNVRRRVGTILDAEVITPIGGDLISGTGIYQGFARLKANVLQQVSENEYVAGGAAITTSRMGQPRYWVQSREIRLRDVPVVRGDFDAGMAVPDRSQSIQARGNYLFLLGVPVFYGPSLKTT